MNKVFEDTPHVFNFLRKKLKLPANAYFERIETHTVVDTCCLVLVGKATDLTATEQDEHKAREIGEVVASQKTFRIMLGRRECLFSRGNDKDKRIHFTIGKYQDGLECWLIYADGTTERIELKPNDH